MSDHNEHVRAWTLYKLMLDAGEPARKRLEMEYDGINGRLPKWTPDNYKNDFIRIRGRLLDSRELSYEYIMLWMDKYRDSFLLGTESDGFTVLREYPNGKPIDWYAFTDEIGLLAWLRWCVFDLDKKTAREQLYDGFSGIVDAGDKGREQKNKKYASIEDFCIKTADGIWSEYQEAGKRQFTVPEMAGKIFNSDSFDERATRRKVKGKKGKVKVVVSPSQETIEKSLRQAKKDGKIVIFKK